MSNPWVGEAQPCGRGEEECPGPAEPEEDGEVRYLKCTRPECGFEYGWTVVQLAQDTCQAGIPEETRLAYARTMEPASGGPVFLGSSIRRRAE